jgi:hypothetical protein
VLPPGSRGPGREPLLERVSDSDFARERRRGYVMEQILYEPVELTEFELDAVAGGSLFGSVFGNNTNSGSFSNLFNANANGAGSKAEVSIVEIVFDNHPTTSIVNVVDNSISVG